MIRRFLAALAAASGLVLAGAAAPAAAQTAACAVTPDPVAYGAPFALTLTGATPGSYYEARLSEAGLPGVYDPLLLGEAGDAGSISLASSDYTYLTPGTVKVKWYLLDANRNYNGGSVACTVPFTIEAP